MIGRGRGMKIAKYHTIDGKEVEIEYDEKAPCIVCGFPVVAASMGGTKLCPWCDCGNERPEVEEARRKALKENNNGG